MSAPAPTAERPPAAPRPGSGGTAPGIAVAASTVAEKVTGAEPAPAGTGPVMFEALAFLLPLIGYPVLIIIEIPVLRREPVTERRRAAATVLAIISLVAAAPLLVMAGALGAFGVLLLGGLVVPAALTLVRLRQSPRAATAS